ncbi:MAG: serine/threonine protein kinase [Deltaproteobacteria bacterium]|nr:serine/threonine protein kinase [Deltaproteobacteria bacterium]
MMGNAKLICHGCGRLIPKASLGARCPHDGLALVPEEEHLRSANDTILGRVLGGKYPVIGLIGSGGMGAVYRALQEPVGREVAIKVIRTSPNVDEEALKARFVREAKVVSRLSNPCTVTLYDYGVEDDGVIYMALELVKGRRLDSVLSSEGPLSPERAVSIARQILNALSEAHAAGLVHRDLKPENIMLARGPWDEEQVKVLDFGIAKVLSGGAVPKDALQTRTGTAIGTPRYMAPEQAIGQTEARSDLYALGVVLYQMLSGVIPFDRPSPMDVLLAHRDDPVPPFPATLRIPAALEAEVRKSLSKEPGSRHGNAREMAAALAAALPLAPQPAPAVEDPDATVLDIPPVNLSGARAWPPDATPVEDPGQTLGRAAPEDLNDTSPRLPAREDPEQTLKSAPPIVVSSLPRRPPAAAAMEEQSAPPKPLGRSWVRTSEEATHHVPASDNASVWGPLGLKRATPPWHLWIVGALALLAVAAVIAVLLLWPSSQDGEPAVEPVVAPAPAAPVPLAEPPPLDPSATKPAEAATEPTRPSKLTTPAPAPRTSRRDNRQTKPPAAKKPAKKPLADDPDYL